MEKVLVTGCAGFIGSHLIEKLLLSEYHVTGVDALTDYYNPGIKKENIKAALQNEKFTFIQEDLLTTGITKNINQFDFIFHLAAQPGVRDSWGKFFNSYVNNNILTTQILLEAVKESKRVKKFIFASSSSVYGEITKEKVLEEDPVKPYSPYGVTKLAAENLCSLYKKNFGLPTVSLRFFSVYGPRQRPDMAFSKLIKSAIKGSDFTLYGNGCQQRDFTYVDDIVEGIMKAAFNEKCNGVYNLGSNSMTSVNEVISFVEEIIDKKISIKYLPFQKGDVQKTSADISKAQKDFCYSPRYGVFQGIEKQINFYRDNNKQ